MAGRKACVVRGVATDKATTRGDTKAKEENKIISTRQAEIKDEKQKAKKDAVKSKRYKDKTLCNEEQDKAFHASEIERHRQYRASLDEEKKQQIRQLHQVRQARYRECKKAEAAAAKGKENTVTDLNAAVEKKRLKNTLAAQTIRGGFTPEQGAAVNKKRRERCQRQRLFVKTNEVKKELDDKSVIRKRNIHTQQPAFNTENERHRCNGASLSNEKRQLQRVRHARFYGRKKFEAVVIRRKIMTTPKDVKRTRRKNVCVELRDEKKTIAVEDDMQCSELEENREVTNVNRFDIPVKQEVEDVDAPRRVFSIRVKLKRERGNACCKHYAKRFRNKIHFDEEKYKTHRSAENNRHRQRRHRSSLSNDKKQQIRELQCIRQNRFREPQRAERVFLQKKKRIRKFNDEQHLKNLLASRRLRLRLRDR